MKEQVQVAILADTELPEGWASAELGIVSELQSGAGFPLEYQGKTGLTYPFFKVGSLGEVEPGCVLYTSSDSVDEELARQLGAKIIPGGSVLFAKIGMAIRLNRRRLVGKACCIDNNLMAAIPAGAVHPRFLLRYLETQEFMPLATATTVPSLRKSELEQISVPLPPLAEQKRIVAKVERLLGRVNAARQRLAKAGPILKRFRQSVLAAACSGQLTADWRQDRNEHGPWMAASLRDVGTVRGGITKNAKRAGLRLQVPYLRVANVYENRLDSSEVLTIGVTQDEYERTVLTRGDLLFVEGNGSIDQIGRVAMWDGRIEGCVHQNHLIRFIAGDSVLPAFVLYCMMAPAGRAQLIEKAISSAGLHSLSISKVAEAELEIPRKDEQREIVRRVEALFALADKIEARVQAATARVEKITQAILAKAFRGELVPTEAELARQEGRDYEPASALLERIRCERQASEATAPHVGKGHKARAVARG